MHTALDLFNPSDRLAVIRNHKHDYATFFQKIVKRPVRALIIELIEHPDFFTEHERRNILREYTEAIELCGMYDMIGKDVDSQIYEIQKTIIPSIKKLKNFYNKIYAQYRTDNVIPENPYLLPHLLRAINSSDKLCGLMTNMQSDGYGKPSVFTLWEMVYQVFNEDRDEYVNNGVETSYICDFFGGDTRNLKVSMDKDGLRMHVLDNLINNIHTHAFKDSLTFESRRYTQGKNFSMAPSDTNIEQIQKEEYREKKVRVTMQLDKTDEHRLNMIIDNNGEKFTGDTDSIFNYGVGNGTGIGLASAKSFLEHHGGNIKMVAYENDDYTVGFIINLPIYCERNEL